MATNTGRRLWCIHAAWIDSLLRLGTKHPLHEFVNALMRYERTHTLVCRRPRSFNAADKHRKAFEQLVAAAKRLASA